MKFVKAPKHIASLATTKGWSGRSHHPRKSETPVDFIGVDGEGMTVNGKHRYVLFGVGNEQIEDASGLYWKDIFEFLYSKRKTGTAFVGFFLGYDFTQIFSTLPEDRARILLTTEGRALRKHQIPGKAPHPVEHEGWQFDTLGMKRLRIRPKTCSCDNATCSCIHEPWLYVCDTGGFFQTAFLNVIDPAGWTDETRVVTDDEFKLIKAGKELRSTAVLDSDMRQYNILENEVLSRVMRSVDAGFHQIGIHLSPSKWFGPGQAAQAWLKAENVTTGEDARASVPDWFLEIARASYYGGWFEQFIHGHIPGGSHEYDINSAYPSIIARLPCLLHGKYSRGEGLPDARSGDLCLVYANVWTPDMPSGNKPQHIGAMLHRDGTGRILRPRATAGWYWWDELQAAQRVGLIKRLDNRGKQKVLHWVKYEPCDCLPPMREVEGLYLKRLEVGKNSPLGKAAKLVYNSEYGKFAQSIGEPIYGNPVYASRITSGCRTQILDAIATHPLGKAGVSMVATDAVYFLTPHPGLAISPKLGEWDYTSKQNLTLFKPGVYWDDKTRHKIANGENPSFKARGFKASDFIASLARVDDEYAAWDQLPPERLGDTWPTVQFVASFAMTTALQALRQGHWERAGLVATGMTLTQSADPHAKRTGLYRDTLSDGRVVYRSHPHYCMDSVEGELQWIPTHPYQKRFGMDDPWSEEYKSQLGVGPDGHIADQIAWILRGE